jgi:hypothetical protein
MSALIEGFVHHVPREHLARIVGDDIGEVLLQECRKLLRGEVVLRQPLRIRLTPDQGTPRTFMSRVLAKETILSPYLKSKVCESGRRTHHFRVSSGSTMLNSRASVAE